VLAGIGKTEFVLNIHCDFVSGGGRRTVHRMLKMAVQRGRSEQRGEATLRYVEPLSDARTMLADFFSILLEVAA